MTIDEWYSQLYRFATGWLGYTPKVALNSNIVHLEEALEGKFDFIRKTNPWGSSKKDKDEELMESVGPENVAKKLQAWALKMQGYKPDPSRPKSQKEGVILPPGMVMPTLPTIKK